eukprot:14842-Heterococcus_DN1.PRE.3
MSALPWPSTAAASCDAACCRTKSAAYQTPNFCCVFATHQVVEKTETGGRKVTREGQQDLDRIAGQVNRGDDE